jgi:hypothetical protein
MKQKGRGLRILHKALLNRSGMTEFAVTGKGKEKMTDKRVDCRDLYASI